jgi:uncharacterized protein (DUF427 family)
MSWIYTGKIRPPFADAVAEGQESVWDYPRPPVIQPDTRRVIVRVGESVIADTLKARRVLETASPPTFYLPATDVRADWLRWGQPQSFCEWKGAASYCDLHLPARRVRQVGWRYELPSADFSELADYVAFYPAKVECYVDGERVRPQPGLFYGGWVTAEIVGPMKGEPGTGHW